RSFVATLGPASLGRSGHHRSIHGRIDRSSCIRQRTQRTHDDLGKTGAPIQPGSAGSVRRGMIQGTRLTLMLSKSASIMVRVRSGAQFSAVFRTRTLLKSVIGAPASTTGLPG